MIYDVNFNLNFTYVLARGEGSIHDANTINGNLDLPDRLKVLQGKFYLEYARYGCHHGILQPFRSTRYNLNGFSARHYLRTPINFSISYTLALE
jgi:hypothetical protein